jgi:hypothetical protein
MAQSMDRLMSLVTEPFDALAGLMKKRSLWMTVISLLMLTLLNIAVMADVGGLTQSRSMTIAIGMLIAMFTLLFLVAIYFEYRKRFPTREKKVEDIVCRDCSFFAGKALLCEGCHRNPYEKRGVKFDILESI